MRNTDKFITEPLRPRQREMKKRMQQQERGLTQAQWLFRQFEDAFTLSSLKSRGIDAARARKDASK